MPRRRIWRWIAAGAAPVAVATIAAWQISLVIERRACSAKSDAELLAMAREGAGSVAAQLATRAVNPTPVRTRYDPNASARAEFTFRTRGVHPQTVDAWITHNCHVMVGWLETMPP